MDFYKAKIITYISLFVFMIFLCMEPPTVYVPKNKNPTCCNG